MDPTEGVAETVRRRKEDEPESARQSQMAVAGMLPMGSGMFIMKALIMK